MNKTFSDFPTIKEKANSIIEFASKVILILNCLILLANLLIEQLDNQDLTQRFIKRSNSILALSFLFVLIIRLRLYFEPESKSLHLFLVLINLTLPFFIVSGTMRTIFKLQFDVIIFACLLEISLRFYLLYELPEMDKAFQFSSLFTVIALSLISVAVHTRFNSPVLSYNLVNIFMHALVCLQSRQLKISHIKDKLAVQAIKEKKQQVDSVLQALKIGIAFADENGNIRSNSIFNSIVGNKLDENILKGLLENMEPLESPSRQVKSALKAIKKAISIKSLIIQLNPFSDLFISFRTIGVIENAAETILLKLRFAKRKYKARTIELILIRSESATMRDTTHKRSSKSSTFEFAKCNGSITRVVKMCADLYGLDILKETQTMPIEKIGRLFNILSILLNREEIQDSRVKVDSVANKWRAFFSHKIGNPEQFTISVEPFVTAFVCNFKKLNAVMVCLLGECVGLNGARVNLECKFEGNANMEICFSVSITSLEIQESEDSVFLKVARELVKQLDSILLVTKKPGELKFEFGFATHVVSETQSFSSYFDSDVSRISSDQLDDLEEVSEQIEVIDTLWD